MRRKKNSESSNQKIRELFISSSNLTSQLKKVVLLENIKDLFNFMLLFFYSKLSSRLQKIILKTFYKTFFFELSKVRFLKYYMVKIKNKSYQCVEFKDKIKLVGFLPTKY